MATKIASLYAELGVKTDQLKSGLGQAKTSLQQTGNAMDSTAKQSSKLSNAMGLLAVAGVAALGKFALDSIRHASDLNETISKTKIVLGEASASVLAYAKDTAASFGLSQQAALDAAATFGIFGKSAGLSGNELADFSLGLTSLASDLASFHNARPEDVVLALGAALRGESEPMRRFGVLLDDATLRSKALELGIISTTKNALTPQQRVLAAQAVIMEQTSDAQGDFARTSDGLANQTRILNAQMANLSVTIGSELLPGAIKVIAVINALTSDVVDFGHTQDALLKAVREHVITEKEWRDVLGQVRSRKMSDAEATEFLKKKYDALRPAVDRTADAGYRHAGIMQREVIPSTNELKQASEELARVLQDELKQQLSDLQSLINGQLGPSFDDFVEKQKNTQKAIKDTDDKYDEQIGKMAEVQEKIDVLNSKSYLTDAQKEDLEELKKKHAEMGEDLEGIGQDYKDLQDQYTKNADEHDKSTKRILLDLIAQRAAMDGLTKDEILMIEGLANKWGLIDKATLDATVAADQALQNLANGVGIKQTQTVLENQLGLLSSIQSVVDYLSGKTFKYAVQGEYTISGIPVGPAAPPGGNIPPLFQQQKPKEIPHAAGGMVYPGMRYTVGEAGPETLVMGQSGGYVIPNSGRGDNGQNITINVNGDVTRDNIYTLARAVGAELNRQSRYN